MADFPKLLKGWSGRRGSNPRRPAWEAGILPLNYSRSPRLNIDHGKFHCKGCNLKGAVPFEEDKLELSGGRCFPP